MVDRLDRLLLSRGLARSRSHARALVLAGAVRVDGVPVTKPAALVPEGAEVSAVADHYVSRAAHKLLGVLDALDLAVGGRALDAGSSTGGFTQVLLERGCAPVYAVDVGTDQLAPSLRSDPRVVVREQTNLRDLTLAHLDDHPVDLVVADVSFISLTLLVEPLAAVTRPDGRMLLMVKPQFEVGRARLGSGGVVREPALHLEAVATVLRAAERSGWHAHAVRPSPLPGPAGNREFFVLLATAPPVVPPDVGAATEAPPGPAAAG